MTVPTSVRPPHDPTRDTAPDTFDDIEDGPPGGTDINVGAIINFYAQLGQPAEYKNVKEAFLDPLDEESIELKVLHKIDEQGNLVGLLRALKTTDAAGVVYEVSVHPDHRRKRLASRMVEALKLRAPEVQTWYGNPFRVKAPLERTLASIRTLFGVSLLLGFREVALTAYEVFKTRERYSAGDFGLLSVLLVALVLLGIRLFWAVEVIFRFVLSRVGLVKPPRTLRLVLLNYPVLFLHAIGFFFLCATFGRIAWSLSTSDDEAGRQAKQFVVQGARVDFIVAYCALLLLNCFWLNDFLPANRKIFRWPFARSTRPELTSAPPSALGPPLPEEVWIKNNLTFVVFGLFCLVFCAMSDRTSTVPLLFAGVLLIANSVFDVYRTRHSYAWGDPFSGG